MAVDTIMTHTLPTIIGAGVASRATETMFGRGGSRRGKRRTTRGTAKRKATTKTTKPKSTGTKGWHPANWFTTKAGAEKDAAYFRKMGHEVKIVKAYDPYFKKWGYKTYVR